jgi:hypothetical protein
MADSRKTKNALICPSTSEVETSLKGEGWYRCLQFTPGSYYSNFIISIQRSYNSPQDEHYIFSVSIGYNGEASITQLSGSKGGQLITRVRTVQTQQTGVGDNSYFDFYVKTDNTAYANSYCWELYSGDGVLLDLTKVSDTVESNQYVKTFNTNNGLVTNQLVLNPNSFSINFRPGSDSYTTGFYYGTAENEGLTLATKQSCTAIQFINGQDPSQLAPGS